MKAVTTKTIAKAMGTTRQFIERRAAAEHWLYRKKGKVIEWEQSSLPQDVVSALASSRIEAVRKTDVPAPRMGGDLLKQAREKDRQKALLKSTLLSRFDQSGLRAEDFVAAYNSGSVSASLRAELGSVSVPTLYRWIADKRESGTDGLVPRYGFVKRGSRSLDEIMRAYLEYYWLDPRRPSIRHAYLNTCDHVGKAPSYATCKRYLESLPKPLIDYHRLGQTKFDAGNYPYIERNMALYHAMDQLVSDHHRFDFLVEREGNLFRPWITAVQDFRSAKIVGFCPAVYPNAVTIAVAFYVAVTRYGSAKLIHIDNGKDYRCQVLNGKKGKLVVLNKDGIGEEEEVRIEGAYSVFAERVTFAKPYHGSSKGRMERTFGTFCEYFSREIPTYVGSNTVERPEDADLFFRAINKKAKRHDIYPWDEYVRALAAFVDWWNSSWTHTGNGMDGKSPDQVFAEQSVEMRPVDPDVLALALSRSEVRKVRRNGVHLEGVNYWAEGLIEYVGRDVVVRRLIGNQDEALICDAKGRVLCHARADWFVETGDLDADNERVNAARKATLELVKRHTSGRAALPAKPKSLVERLTQGSPAIEESPAELPIAVGLEPTRTQAANQFIDFLMGESYGKQ